MDPAKGGQPPPNPSTATTTGKEESEKKKQGRKNRGRGKKSSESEPRQQQQQQNEGKQPAVLHKKKKKRNPRKTAVVTANDGQQQQQPQQQQQQQQPAPISIAALGRKARGGGKPIQQGRSKWHGNSPKPAADPSLVRQQSDPDVDVKVSARAATLSKQMASKEGYSCCICLNAVRSNQPVWSCGVCHTLVHHKCVKQWFTMHVKKALGEKKGGHNSNKLSHVRWRCPGGCNAEGRGPPGAPTCYCGKETDPRVIYDHSCKHVCDKQFLKCKHYCSQICHPGKCGVCPRMAKEDTKCQCGKTSVRLRCGEEKSEFTCDSICDKLLACNAHRCTRPCHTGSCAPCENDQQQACFCGKVEQRERPCGSGTFVVVNGKPERRFTCMEPCGKQLDCKNHSCTRVCHAGRCDPCALRPKLDSELSYCACGKSIVSEKRTSCLDPLTTCKSVCGKMKSCGSHRCAEQCHDGPCGECTERIKLPCRCGGVSVVFDCQRVANGLDAAHLQQDMKQKATMNNLGQIVCFRPCGRRLRCQNHFCKDTCCVSDSHLCLNFCSRKHKDCGHECGELCHGGNCPPCSHLLADDYSCPCGNVTVPGPRLCRGVIPDCHKPCSRPRKPGCTHPCPYTCHPDYECPPCVQLVAGKMCAGGHGPIDAMLPCHVAAPSCSLPCKNVLSCGRHTCSRRCHDGPCVVDHNKLYSQRSLWLKKQKSVERRAEEEQKAREEAEKQGLRSCGLKCELKREACEHRCLAICHVGESCPDLPCTAKVMLRCPCGRQKQESPCGAFSKRVGADVIAQIKRSEQMEGIRDDGEEGVPVLVCDGECAKQQRNAKLRDALQIGDDHEQRILTITVPDLLLEQILRDSELHRRVGVYEKQIYEFVTLQKDVNSFQFPPMKREFRWLVHNIASFYNLETESFGSADKRNVRLLRNKATKVPSMTFGEALQLYKAKQGQYTYRSTESKIRSLPSKFQIHFMDLDHSEDRTVSASQDSSGFLSQAHQTRTAPRGRIEQYDIMRMLHKFWDDYHITCISPNHIIAVFYDEKKVHDVVNMLTQHKVGRPLFHRGLPDPAHDETYDMDTIETYKFVLVPGPAPSDRKQSSSSSSVATMGSTATDDWRSSAPPGLSSWDRLHLGEGGATEEEWVTVSSGKTPPAEPVYVPPARRNDAWGSSDDEDEGGKDVGVFLSHTGEEIVTQSKKPVHLRRGFINEKKAAEDAKRAEEQRQLEDERLARQQAQLTEKFMNKAGKANKNTLSSNNQWAALMSDQEESSTDSEV